MSFDDTLTLANFSFVYFLQFYLLKFFWHFFNGGVWTPQTSPLATPLVNIQCVYCLLLTLNNVQEVPGTLTTWCKEYVSSLDVGIFWVDSECTFNIRNNVCLTFLVGCTCCTMKVVLSLLVYLRKVVSQWTYSASTVCFWPTIMYRKSQGLWLRQEGSL